MGVDAGFDIFPPLDSSNQKEWDDFLAKVKETFADDSAFQEDEKRIYFVVGEHPTLTKTAEDFRTFTSKISGSCVLAEKYIEIVAKIARSHFRDRVHLWNEEYSERDHHFPHRDLRPNYMSKFSLYSWDEIRDPSPIEPPRHSEELEELNSEILRELRRAKFVEKKL